jgi:hypothetical protein
MKKLLCATIILSISLCPIVLAKNASKKTYPIFLGSTLNSNSIDPSVYKIAVAAYNNAIKKGVEINKKVITVIDFSRPSNEKRLWVLDLENRKVLFHTLVAHGKYSGENYPNSFSDRPGSLQSSIGVFLTKNTYQGHNGYTLVLAGLEKGYNNHAESRRVVMHGAHYVNEQIANTHGRIGRSWGCPAVDTKLAKPIINTIKDGTLMIAYYPDKKWLRESEYLT